MASSAAAVCAQVVFRRSAETCTYDGGRRCPQLLRIPPRLHLRILQGLGHWQAVAQRVSHASGQGAAAAGPRGCGQVADELEDEQITAFVFILVIC